MKIVATRSRCHILRLKCTKFTFSWGSATDPTGELTVLPETPQLVLRGRTSKGLEGRGRNGQRKGGEGEREGEGCIMAVVGGGEWKPLVNCNAYHSFVVKAFILFLIFNFIKQQLQR